MEKKFFEIQYETCCNSFGLELTADDWQVYYYDLLLLFESLLSANTQDLVRFFNEKTEEDILLLPLWMRMLIFRLYILENPEDKDFIEMAKCDVALFGDDAFDFVEIISRIK